MKAKIMLVLLLLVASCATVKVDEGGSVIEYRDQVLLAKSRCENVVLDYDCYSACIMRLGSGPGLCVSKKARFYVHEPRYLLPGMPYEQGLRADRAVEINRKIIPECAMKLFESKKALDSSEFILFTGEEVLRACPELKECPNVKK